MIIKTLTVGIVLLSFIRPGYSLECYSCSAEIGKGADCDDPPNTGRIERMECTALYETECIKYTVETQLTKTIFRGCYPKATDTCEVLKNATEISSLMKVPYCGTCDRDYCNSANIPLMSGTLLIFFVIGFIYL